MMEEWHCSCRRILFLLAIYGDLLFGRLIPPSSSVVVHHGIRMLHSGECHHVLCREVPSSALDGFAVVHRLWRLWRRVGMPLCFHIVIA